MLAAVTRLGQSILIPAAWRGAELLRRDDAVVSLGPDDRAELDAAVAASRAVPLDQIDRRAFPLPTLGRKLAWLQDRLEHGSGATWLRGLGDDTADEGLVARRFWGLATHLGTPVSQSAAGERLLQVRNRGLGADDPRRRGPHTNLRLGFHTDRCDIIAFCCVRPARAGGDNHILSSITLHNELARRHPDAVATLAEPLAYLRHTVDGGNVRPYTMVPLFTVHEGRFAASYLRILIDRADRDPAAPSLTGKQRQALARLEQVAEDPELYATLRLAAGDVLLLNNWVTFHRRTAFDDDPDPGQHRLLLRLWLSPPNSRALDPRFAEHFGATAAGAVRGGMRPAADG
ncbi:MAG: TauD/TfdA family dioxygenase [Planctomycetota bacterium]